MRPPGGPVPMPLGPQRRLHAASAEGGAARGAALCAAAAQRRPAMARGAGGQSQRKALVTVQMTYVIICRIVRMRHDAARTCVFLEISA